MLRAVTVLAAALVLTARLYRKRLDRRRAGSLHAPGAIGGPL
jgi:hypothetical protein